MNLGLCVPKFCIVYEILLHMIWIYDAIGHACQLRVVVNNLS